MASLRPPPSASPSSSSTRNNVPDRNRRCAVCNKKEREKKEDTTEWTDTLLQDVIHNTATHSNRRHTLDEEVRLLREANTRMNNTITHLNIKIERQGHHKELLDAKEREIELLRQQIRDFNSRDHSHHYYDHADRTLLEVQSTVRQLEDDLMTLRDERSNLSLRVAELQREVATKQADARRCERQMAITNREKAQLQIELRKARSTTVKRSRSDADLTAPTDRRSASRGRSPFGGRRSVNMYCPVCRDMREQLLASAPLTRHPSPSRSPPRRLIAERVGGSPDSGFADRVAERDVAARLQLTEERLTREQSNYRLLQHERDSLKDLHEQAQSEVARLRRELLERHSQPFTTSNWTEGRSTLVDSLRTDNDKLRRQLQAVKERGQNDKSRLQANTSLLTAQKTKLEQDCRDLEARCEQLQTELTTFTLQLGEKDTTIDRLNSQLRHQTAHKSSDHLSAGFDAQLRNYEKTVADWTMKARKADDARTVAESKFVGCRRELEDARKETTRLRAQMEALRSEVQMLADSSGDMLDAGTAALRLQLRDKDAEIHNLRSRVSSFDREYQKFQKDLVAQQGTLDVLREDLILTTTQKSNSEQRCVWLQEENERLASRLRLLEDDRTALRRDLEAAIAQHEDMNTAAERHLSEILTYQQQLARKEAERAALLAQLQDVAGEAQRSVTGTASLGTAQTGVVDDDLHHVQLQSLTDELNSARAQKSKLMDERSALQARLVRCEALLEAARNDAETERKLKESLHSDYADARRQIIAKDGEVVELIGRLSRVETELAKAKAHIDLLTTDVEMEKAKCATATDEVTKLEKAVQEKREQQRNMTLAAQQSSAEMMLLKTRLQEHERKLEAQGRDLTDAQNKLAQALREVDVVKREILEEQFERQRLQSRLDSHSQSTASS